VAACYRCREATPYGLVKCSRAGCHTWVQASCSESESVPNCPHYLTATDSDCGTSLYLPTLWRCPDCELKDRGGGAYGSDDVRHASPYVRRRHRSLPKHGAAIDLSFKMQG
jgi:hypothetical protein